VGTKEEEGVKITRILTVQVGLQEKERERKNKPYYWGKKRFQATDLYIVEKGG